MAWLVLILSAVFEAVWATALGMSQTFTVLVPTIVFVVGTVISLTGLGYAMKTIPVGTAYAVWTGIGAALTVGYAVLTGTETMTVGKAVFLVGIIGAVIGLKLVSDPPTDPAVDPVAALPVVPSAVLSVEPATDSPSDSGTGLPVDSPPRE